MTEFYVKVLPDSDTFRIDMDGTYPVVHVTEPASQGRANHELVSRLSALLDREVGIISGHRTRRKKLVVDRETEEIDEILGAESPDSGA